MNRTTALAWLVAAVGLGLVALAMASAPTAGQVTPIYNNSTADVGNETWLAGNEDVNLVSFGRMLTRIGTFVIGDTSSGAGPLFTGLLVGGLVLGIVGTSRVGLVSGGMLGVVTAAAVSGPLGVGPPWLYGLVVMLLGFVTAAVYLRVIR